jgi:hypothetical protein
MSLLEKDMDLHLAVFLVIIGCCCFVLKNKREEYCALTLGCD